MGPLKSILTFRNFYTGLPFYGRSGGFEFITAHGPFDPAMTLKMLQLKDMAPPAINKFTDFDELIANVRLNLRAGDRVKAIKVNSKVARKETKHVIGVIHDIKIDHANKNIRVFVKEHTTNEIFEVYLQTVYREDTRYVEESLNYVMKFSQFQLIKN